MKTRVKKWLVMHGNAICAVAVSLASLSSLCCRGTWYQPEENVISPSFDRRKL